jgi:hypothetical protein
MYYFEHYLRGAGLSGLSRVAILGTRDDEWVFDDLRAEILDVYPAAQVVRAEATGGDHADLLVVPLTSPSTFPFADVVYDHLDALDRVGPEVARADFVMVYRVWWREVELIPSREWAAWLRSRRRERWIIRVLRRITALPALLRPRYPS